MWTRPFLARAATAILFGLGLAMLGVRNARALSAAEVAVVINTADPLSVEIGRYYAQQRHIPPQNIRRISFGFHRTIMPADEFTRLKASIDVHLPKSIQAYALTWVKPYRVECMSITSAFAFGFDERFCAHGCAVTQFSPYYDSDTRMPFDDLHVRPAMSIAALSFTDARALIDRGVQADGTAPRGTAYLVSTGDAARDVRIENYPDVLMLAANRMAVHIADAKAIENRADVMFYFIGAIRVPGLSSNHFLPGAVADHLTSTGGELTGGTQMSSLRWLEAGATGSYGTVVEPCNYTAKFPNPALLLRHYLAGETLIEAYWKSVAMPGQGIFIGEPLAAPYLSALHRTGSKE
jgi:uncharacterized protein (TIGR03790 family)